MGEARWVARPPPWKLWFEQWNELHPGHRFQNYNSFREYFVRGAAAVNELNVSWLAPPRFFKGRLGSATVPPAKRAVLRPDRGRDMQDPVYGLPGTPTFEALGWIR
jgi:hypothetical protein